MFYLNSFSTEENFKDFSISFKRKFSKTDKAFIKYLMNEYSEKKDVFLSINKASVKNNHKYNNDEEIIQYLDKFMQLKLYYSFTDPNNYICKGAFNIIDSFFVEKESIVIILSKELLMAFEKDNNFFSRINLKSIFKFENSNTLKLYLKLLNTIGEKEEIDLEFNLDEFKIFLDVCDCYDRYYDFEKNIIEPIIEDLNRYTEYSVSYEKFKKSPAPSSKIIGVRFHSVNKKIKEIRVQTNNLLSLVKTKVNNFDSIYKIIFDSIKKFGYKYVEDNLSFANSKKDNKNFESIFIKALEENSFNANTPNYSENHILIEKVLRSPYEIHEELYIALQKIGLENKAEGHLFLGSFINKIYQLRDGESYGFTKEGIKISIFYRKNGKSLIEIFVE